MKKRKIEYNKIEFADALILGEEAKQNGYIVADNYGREGKIVNIDSENKDYAFLVKFKDKTLGWVAYDCILTFNKYGRE